MADEPYIPPATVQKLSENHQKGTRHQAAIDIAVSLIGSGLPNQAVYATLRSKFDDDVSDHELEDIVEWVRKKNPKPCTPGGNGAGNGQSQYRPAAKPEKSRTPLEQCDWWTSGLRLDADGLCGMSPLEIPEDPKECGILFFSSLYTERENINVVCKFLLDGDKAKPLGGGKVLARDQWIEHITRGGVPNSKAGAWVRMNPCASVGTGKDGAITDGDVTSYRFLLLESDSLPIPVQLAMFSRLRLPIAMVVLSGGGSAHAWIRIGSVNGEDYSENGRRVLALLKPFGIDQANKNASRLSRLPGAVRTIGATDGGLQRLLWLNPNAPPLTDQSILDFDESLKFPAIEERPLRAIAGDSLGRYEEMRRNCGRNGLPTGIPKLDAISGGMKPGQTYVVAGITGGGKTTLGMHIIDSVLKAGYGVLVFSLEMDREELFDMLVANRCSIDRNKFNTGNFTDYDFQVIPVAMGPISKLPLYIEDSAVIGVEQIRSRTMQLRSAGKIDIVIVDYIQFVNPGVSRESREQQVANISHTLRSIARETRLPMVVLSQLNDEGKLRESRVIAHNANVVMVVDVKNDDVTIKVIKGRSIPCGDYKMDFNRRFCRLEPRDDPEPND